MEGTTYLTILAVLEGLFCYEKLVVGCVLNTPHGRFTDSRGRRGRLEFRLFRPEAIEERSLYARAAFGVRDSGESEERKVMGGTEFSSGQSVVGLRLIKTSLESAHLEWRSSVYNIISGTEESYCDTALGNMPPFLFTERCIESSVPSFTR